ncbi:hypothetical protein [Halobacterium sp. R2-5]|uniref:DUF7093 family protein n=1 Tax=Halobacterium sp. R2-5 TaxID=2715751 RepID=UPI00142245C5|nr:hypothetical protein [Halobacterium sp. R2-5]NIB98449.1 hypothetical protein [Halobacterium sp. R2-5]
MGLRCSLLGHDYGEAFVERDREERGEEVVVTERELKECARCGSEKVTTENTEVRSLQPEHHEDADGSSDATDATTTVDSGSEPATAANADASTTDSSGGAFTSATDAIEQAETGMDTDDSLGGEPDADDAVILEDDAADEPGSDQWDEPEEPEAEPEPEPVEDDAEVVDAGSEPEPEPEPTQSGPAGQQSASAETADADRARGEWPEADGEDEGFDATADADAEFAAAEEADSTFEFAGEGDEAVEADTGFTSAGPLDNDESTDELDFALYCPECGFEQYAAGSSLRAGDICPECRRGYLAEDR